MAGKCLSGFSGRVLCNPSIAPQNIFNMHNTQTGTATQNRVSSQNNTPPGAPTKPKWMRTPMAYLSEFHETYVGTSEFSIDALESHIMESGAALIEKFPDCADDTAKNMQALMWLLRVERAYTYYKNGRA